MNTPTILQEKHQQFDRINALIAASIFFISFIVYYMTMAPSLSFWDCGEFIACSYILGIPHPPGSPLYVLIGRLFTLLPIASDIAVRVNLLSVFSSAFTALFCYLVTVRLIQHWFVDRFDIYNRVIAYIGGFVGALFVAFSSTNWANSVEAEVYAGTMLLMMMIYWLALKYLDYKGKNPATKYLLLATYIGVLGIGIHLTLFVVVPVVGLYFILNKRAGNRQWAIMAIFFLTELFLIFQLSSRPDEVPFYLPVLVIFIIFIFHLTQIGRPPKIIFAPLVLYLLSLYPVFFIIVGAISRNVMGVELSPSLVELGNFPVGWVGFTGLTLFGIYSLFRYLVKPSKNIGKDEWLLLTVYSLAPVILVAIGSVFKGYSSFLLLTVLIIAVMTIILWKYFNWSILIALGAVLTVTLGFWQFVWGLLGGAVIIIALMIFRKDSNWKTALSIILLAIIGYSVHIYIPVRSAHNPSIDENNPSESMTALVGYLERKQYGSMSMTERMFKRRGEWVNQFGDYRRMGFWRFFKEQYGLDGSRYFIMLILGLFGIWETIRRKPSIGVPFLILVLICSVGLVLYMNFADGTRMTPSGGDYTEVRNRDYFFTPAFIFFGMAIGLGVAALMGFFRDMVQNSSPGMQKTVFYLSTLLVLLPIIPAKANYYYNDRSANFMAFDYANNILKACNKDGILITNGDNDTFPVWCLQEVYGIRKDVRVVNLSLANISWYIKQLSNYHDVPIRLSNDEIDRMRPFIDPDGTRYRLQDQVIDHIIIGNNWKVPIHMTVTTPSENRRFKGKSLNEYLILEGMVYTLTKTRDKKQINYPKTRRMFIDEYSYRGINDSTIFMNEATRRLTNNYAQGFMWLADTLRKAGDIEGAFEHLKSGIKNLPETFELYGYGIQLLGEHGWADTAKVFIERARTDRKQELYMQWGYAARSAGRMDDAFMAFRTVQEKHPDFIDGFHALAGMYYQSKDWENVKRVALDWLDRHPDDFETKQLLMEVERIGRSEDSTEGNN